MGKPRVIVTTDIGGSDPDDMQSMAHFLTHADKFDIKALISSPTGHGGRASHINKALDAYTADYSKLKTWGDYQTPEFLKSVVYQGNLNVAPTAGYSTATTASNAIIKAAKDAKAAGDPLYVMAWGALTDVAQALHDDPSIASTIRVLASNGWNYTQDPNAYNYTLSFAKSGMWMIDSKSTHRGIYLDSSGGTNNGYDLNNAKGHGALGDYFYNARPWGIKMGDSWSVAYLLDAADNNNPTLTTSWGGTFLKNGLGANYYTDDPSSSWYLGGYKGAKHVYMHQKTIYNDMSASFDRAKASNPNANVDDPVFANDDAAAALMDTAVVIKVLTNDSAPDGGLQIASFDAASAKGGTVVKNADGTLTYKGAAGFVGTDTFKYVARDTDGDLNDATVTVNVSAVTPPPPPPPTGGTGNPVVAYDDNYTLDAGKSLYFATKYLIMNDKGLDGGLQITSVERVSEHGVAVTDGPSGSLVYKAPTDWNGVDHINYTLVDKDGSTDIGTINITVQGGTVVLPPPPPPPPPSDGTGNPVVAYDDSYKIDSGKSLWVNAKYLTWNDKGLDGGLKVTDVAATSANGYAVSFATDGTIVYKSAAGWNGVDRVDYTVKDVDGSSDIGSMVITVGTGGTTTPPPPPPTGGTGNPVIAYDDAYNVGAGKSLYFATKYLIMNDKGLDGGLKITSIANTTEKGTAITDGPNGSYVYKAPTGFIGTDKVAYTLTDVDGSTDIGHVIFNVSLFG